MPTLQIRLQEEVLNRLGVLAVNEGREREQIVGDAVDKYLQWHDKQMHLWKETEEAIEQADRGEVIKGEEVFSWLDTWGETTSKVV